ncbi:DUF6712 family protein [Chryseobacterium oncorhynchi]|uniref:Uncharacterized protein n=1 Tax=Chryseobacterium oncorhynchi TaxID=741074 RepID=A0A316X5F3_9FLAO|nr:DUF6712 family protein [Chryseobacterium oncorhynchi]PWN67603.1 hypothetical protein C1638_003155 [Chryseobacterium oncorhynchi]
MKFLFKPEDFQKDFKKTVGIVDADMSWDRTRPALVLATDEIIEIIGDDNYNLLSAEPLAPENKEFFDLVKFAVAFKSYIHYAPTGDLSMTNKGRVMRRDDFEVSAFEWQIDTHNNSLKHFYFKHLNLLLKFMVKNNMTIGLIKFQHSKLIVPSLPEFEKHYGLNDSYFLYLNLLPALREFEELEMRPRISSDLYQNRTQLKDKVDLYNICQKAAVYYAITWGLRHLDIQMFPESIVRSTGNASKKNNSVNSQLMPSELALQFEADYEKYLLKIENEMSNLTKPERKLEEFRLPDLDFSDDDNFVST